MTPEVAFVTTVSFKSIKNSFMGVISKHYVYKNVYCTQQCEIYMKLD